MPPHVCLDVIAGELAPQTGLEGRGERGSWVRGEEGRWFSTFNF